MARNRPSRRQRRRYNAPTSGILPQLFGRENTARTQGYAQEATYRWPVLQTSTGVAAVQKFANVIASLDLKCYQIKDHPEPAKRTEQEVPLPQWLQTPLPGVRAYNRRAVIWRAVSSLLLDGNLFLYREPAPRNPEQTTAIIVLDPSQVDVTLAPPETPPASFPSPSQPIQQQTGLRLKFQVSEGHDRNYSAKGDIQAHYGVTGDYTEQHIIWGTYMQLPHTLRGVSPFQLGAIPVEIALHAQAYADTFFTQGANPTSVINMKQAPDPEDEEAFRQKWKEQHHGWSQQGPILTYGDMDVTPLSIDPQRGMLIETRQQGITEIGALANVPSAMLNDTRPGAVSYASADIQRRLFATDSIQPMTQLLEELLNQLLPANQRLRFDIHDIIRGDEATRRELARRDVAGGVITPNEARKSLNMLESESPGADELWMPVNLAPMGTALEMMEMGV